MKLNTMKIKNFQAFKFIGEIENEFK